MGKNKKISLIIILIFLIIFLLLFLPKILLCDLVELNSYLTVGENLGFNVDTDAIYFGTVPVGAFVDRDVYIENARCSKVKVIIKIEGNFSNWVKVSENNFILFENEGKSVNFVVGVPQNAELGNYTNNVKIYFWKTI